MTAQDKLRFVLAGIRTPAKSGDIELCRLLLDAVRDQPSSRWQVQLDYALLIAVSTAHGDLVALFLQHGARARAGEDYIIYLAAVSDRADVMELLLGAADVDAECAARYRQQMSEAAGLLGVAQAMLSEHARSWDESGLPMVFVAAREPTPLDTALLCGHIPAVQWLLNRPDAPAVLGSGRPMVSIVQSGNMEALQVLLQSQSIRSNCDIGWPAVVEIGLAAARTARSPDMIRLLYNEVIGNQLSLEELLKALQWNDPLCREHVTAPFPVSPYRDARAHIWLRYSLIMSACMLTDLALLQDIVALCRRVLQKLQDGISASLERAVQLCTADDMTPVMMLMVYGSYGSLIMGSGQGHPFLVAARSGNVPAVKLWLAKGINAQLLDNEALKRAVQYRHRAVAALLLSNGADPNALSPADRATLHQLC